jgi:hypothetical protein
VSGKAPTDIDFAPTDPSLEFDLFEAVKVRLVDALLRRGYELVEAERIALYVVEFSLPVSHLLKVLAAATPPEDEEAMSALGKVIDEAQALEKARRLLLKIDGD